MPRRKVEDPDEPVWNMKGQGSFLDGFGKAEKTGLGGRNHVLDGTNPTHYQFAGSTSGEGSARGAYQQQLSPNHQHLPSPSAPQHYQQQQQQPYHHFNRGANNPQFGSEVSDHQILGYPSYPQQQPSPMYTQQSPQIPPLVGHHYSNHQQHYAPPMHQPPPHQSPAVSSHAYHVTPSELQALKPGDLLDRLEAGRRGREFTSAAPSSTPGEGTENFQELQAQTEWAQVPSYSAGNGNPYTARSVPSEPLPPPGPVCQFDPNMFGDNAKMLKKKKGKSSSPGSQKSTPRLQGSNRSPNPPQQQQQHLHRSPQPPAQFGGHQHQAVPRLLPQQQPMAYQQQGRVHVVSPDQPRLDPRHDPYDAPTPTQDFGSHHQPAGGRDSKALTGPVNLNEDERDAIEALFATDDFTEKFNAAAEARSQQIAREGGGGNGVGGARQERVTHIGDANWSRDFSRLAQQNQFLAAEDSYTARQQQIPSNGNHSDAPTCHLCHKKLKKDNDVATYLTAPFDPARPTPRRQGGGKANGPAKPGVGHQPKTGRRGR